MTVVRVRRAVSRTGLRICLLLGLLVLAAVGVVYALGGGASGFALIATPTHPRTSNLGVSATATRTGTTATSTSGCGKAPLNPPGTTGAEMLRVGALQRTFRVHIPRGYRSTVATPLVLSFHGRGSSADGQEIRTHFSALADLHHFIVAYPQGVIGPDGVTGWNTGRSQDPTVDDVLYVDDMVTHLQRELCIDPARIYATGFSNGGGFTAILACALANRLAAVAPVAGDYYPQPQGCHPARPLSVLEVHGTADTINPYGGSVELRYPSVPAWLQAWATRDGCSGKPVALSVAAGVTREEWSQCGDGAVIVHYRVSGGPHAWPSLACTRACVPFDASGAIWSFFAQQSLPRTEPAARL